MASLAEGLLLDLHRRTPVLELSVVVCSHCRDHTGRFAEWPCATVRIIEAARQIEKLGQPEDGA